MWENKRDPDPSTKTNFEIGKVVLEFDSLAAFSSPGFFSYTFLYEQIKTILANDTIKLSLTQDLPSNYPQIYWRVRMFDFGRDSADGAFSVPLARLSTQTFVLKQPDLQAPATPIGLTATAGNKQVTLRWDANVESDLASYKVYGGTTPNPTSLLATVPAGTTTYIHTGLTNGTTYHYRVSAVDNAGNESNKTGEVTATSKLSSPQLLNYTQGNTVTSDSVILKWQTVFGAATYVVDLDSAAEYSSTGSFRKTSTVTDTTAALKNLTQGKYYWKVTAISGIDTSLPSINGKFFYALQPKITSTITSIQFSDVKINTPSVRKMSLTNPSVLPQTVDTVYSTLPVFVISGFNKGIAIKFKDTASVTITFTPTELKEYVDTVFIGYTANNKNELLKIALKGVGALTGVLQYSSLLPVQYELYQNFPNPFNPSTTVRFALPEASHTILKIYNMLGQEIAILISAELDAGYYESRFDASVFSSGVYIYRITAEGLNTRKNFIQIKKMMVVK
jgi:hypothetical protein